MILTFRVTIALILALFCLDLSAQEQTIQTHFLTSGDGTKLFVKKSGVGPLAIFIHGGPGAWSKSFEDLKGNHLETQLSMVYYDQRGSGRSDDSVSGDYSIATMISDIDLIRQHYHAEKVFLISHSFGGILAVNYALKYPEHLKGLILANSTLNLPYSLKNQINYTNRLLNTRFNIPDDSPDSIMSTFLKARKALSAEQLSYKILSDSKENVDLVDQIDSQNPSDYDFSKNAFQIDEYWQDHAKISADITVPVLVITGRKDHSIGEQHYLSFDFNNEKVKKIDGGHLLYYENNQQFTQSIFEFVKTVKQ